ncbi:hypothetical protein HK104_009727 [Borealophlyctis nickersoniae]|nr:hypothetical protein HK104_009727 [Borealophlyctis nickersoniae]
MEPEAEPVEPPAALLPINTYDWSYNPSFTRDENYLDLTCLVARSSISLKGHMGAIVVREPDSSQSKESAEGTVLACGINTPFYPPPPGKSIRSSAEIHAETNALAACARNGAATDGATIYITYPPCKDCFVQIVYAGIKRVVFRKRCIIDHIKETAAAWGVELVEGTDIAKDLESVERTKEIVRKWNLANGVVEKAKKTGGVSVGGDGAVGDVNGGASTQAIS